MEKIEKYRKNEKNAKPAENPIVHRPQSFFSKEEKNADSS